MPFTLRRAPTRLLRIVALVAAMLAARPVPLAGARPAPVEWAATPISRLAVDAGSVQPLALGEVVPEYHYFPQTGHWLGHGFLHYWSQFGDLPTFGYPISEEVVENGLTVQYFERARFEWHPGA